MEFSVKLGNFPIKPGPLIQYLQLLFIFRMAALQPAILDLHCLMCLIISYPPFPCFGYLRHKGVG